MNQSEMDGFETGDSRERRVLRVKIADVKTAKSPWVLETLAIGSCVAVCLYDPTRKIGALCHSLLPDPTEEDQPRSAKYVSDAVSMMVDELQKEGCEANSLEAKIIGGANLFESLGAHEELRMGERNTVAAKEKLEQMGIEIKAEETGGPVGRSMKLNIDDGMVLIRSADGNERVI